MKRLLAVLMILLLVTICPDQLLLAETETVPIAGSYYEFDDNAEAYEITAQEPQSSIDNGTAYGKFSIQGALSGPYDKDGIPAYMITNGQISFSYEIGDALLDQPEEQWNLVNDKLQNIDGLILDGKIYYGALVLQTSLNGKDWSTAAVYRDLAYESSGFPGTFYKTEDIQQINGCYYRVIIAYREKQRVEDGHFMFIPYAQYDYKRCAEVYEFYLVDQEYSNGTSNEGTETYELGTTTAVNGTYEEPERITMEDLHYGWDIGQFTIEGYTDTTIDENRNVVFLKNVGEELTLGFTLDQPLDQLNGNEAWVLNEDINGCDPAFGIEEQHFGKGALIIQYTDYEGNQKEPQVFENYLENSTKVGESAKIGFFEEGDYDVALDYEILDTSDHTYHQYRINYHFAIRNNNCTIYPFDAVTAEELSSGAITENGFMLDLNKSRYLMIEVAQHRIDDTDTGYVETEAFSGQASEGTAYKEEGVYTFTVMNKYTGGEIVQKKIYVGNSPVIRAMQSGYGIEEINQKIETGAQLMEDGTFVEQEIKNDFLEQEITLQGAPKGEKHPIAKTVIVFGSMLLILAMAAAPMVILSIRRKNNDEEESGW